MASQSSETKSPTDTPVRAPSAVPVDDTVLPFEVSALDLRGRLSRLGPALDGAADEAGRYADAVRAYAPAVIAELRAGNAP